MTGRTHEKPSQPEARTLGSWRDRIKIHPASNRFPRMPENDLETLARDIAKNGLREGVVLWTPEPPGTSCPAEIYLLDGRNRLDALEWAFANDSEARAEAIRKALSSDPDQGGTARLLFNDTDPEKVSDSLNLHRRHLSQKEKRELIASLLRENPARSDREIARLSDSTATTVGSVRLDQEQSGDVSKLDTRIDSTGRPQPAHKQHLGPKNKPAAREPAMRQNAVISGFAKLLQQGPAETLDNFSRLLSDHRERLAEIPLQSRISSALAYLNAVGVGLHHLRKAEASDDASQSEPSLFTFASADLEP